MLFPIQSRRRGRSRHARVSPGGHRVSPVSSGATRTSPRPRAARSVRRPRAPVGAPRAGGGESAPEPPTRARPVTDKSRDGHLETSRSARARAETVRLTPTKLTTNPPPRPVPSSVLSPTEARAGVRLLRRLRRQERRPRAHLRAQEWIRRERHRRGLRGPGRDRLGQVHRRGEGPHLPHHEAPAHRGRARGDQGQGG